MTTEKVIQYLADIALTVEDYKKDALLEAIYLLSVHVLNEDER